MASLKLTAGNADQISAILVAARLSGVEIEVSYNDSTDPTLCTSGLASIAKSVAAQAASTNETFFSDKVAIDEWLKFADNLTPKNKEAALEKLNSTLAVTSYLTSTSLTLADVYVACCLPPPFKQAIMSGGKNESTMKWLTSILEHPEVEAVLGRGKPKVSAEEDEAKKAKKEAKLKEKEAKKAKAAAKAEKGKGEPAGGGGGANALKKAAAAEEAAKKKVAEELELQQARQLILAVPQGLKKNVSAAMLKAYHPGIVEARWYEWWEQCGYFRPESDSSKPRYVIVIPPPNVTGVLHIGHALTNSVQDTLCRWKRMSGFNTLWLPGTDHAGIATQTVVEKTLMKSSGQTRHDLGRDKFLEKVWEWKEQSGNMIFQQLRRLGSSLDWSRECFTMDPKLSVAVNEAFVRMHSTGLIYRDNRLVNWCCTLKTAISDIEVDYIDIEGETLVSVPGYGEQKVEFGVLTSFAYTLEDGSGEIVVATTRPETMLGDTAVAVHPEDPRYTSMQGKMVIHPFNGRKLPIITDSELVDMSFGTGAVKITPAHDPNDFATGKRHGLEFINIFTETGEVNENGAEYQGMRRFDVRVKLVEDLKVKGLYRGKQNNPMRLGLCSRSKDVIEPLIKPQWWVNCGQMAADACEVVRDGRMEIVPRLFEANWFRWLENIRDWCISRQLWWGHRIPAYYVTLPGEDGEYIGTNETNERWIVGRTYEDAMVIAQQKFPASDLKLTQDPDVLDTWFSSGLFPFSTMGWPNEETSDMKDFFPGSLLETGHDILFFWVARMVMMSMTLTGKVPFDKVYLHAMVRDAHGRKMSKSLGNVIDPLQMIEGMSLEGLHSTLRLGNLDAKEIAKAEAGQKVDFPDGIPECGTDALRFALVAYTTQARDINLDVLRVYGYRTWCNKLWNAIRFAMMNLGDDFMPRPSLGSAEVGSLPMAAQWILSRLNCAVVSTVEALERFDFAAATTAVYAFWQYDLCDVFIELMKTLMQSPDQSVVDGVREGLWWSLDVGLRLLHPFMPFITEELWQRLPRSPEDQDRTPSIMLADYPAPVACWESGEVEREMELLEAITKCLRSERSKYGLTTKQKTPVYVLCNTAAAADIVTRGASYVATLSASESVTAVRESSSVPVGCAVSIVDETCSAYLLLQGILNPQDEVLKLNRRLQDTLKQQADLSKKMDASSYQVKVPENVRNEDHSKAIKLTAELSSIEEAIAGFSRLQMSEQ
mmetsp:Transcript_39595/g.54985  ORF Transcript_39595/g.54985 Transcript_39595/m.54985 type:complete len:1218 (+) Transcript_39595:50-3703(+)|eukprot:CAMPEP_0196570818 /NCGR_PEP_ID=MMETSP1081-20130531/1001_1 /TAXON_ID=36882 /ORGANISM="Pyramimonas amylifera, Strain CCMP720" /LENGTH=1217 /DNA_ID=CAMNT_0041887493 /DNA_START=49 /DNA_END=3702 /DNA_ORIENTATION=-